MFYFLLIGLNAFPLHLRQRTFPSAIFLASALILLEQSLHTKTFLNILVIAAGIFVAILKIDNLTCLLYLIYAHSY